MALISQINQFLVEMWCSQVCVFWMRASTGLSGLFLVGIWLACGPDLGNMWTAQVPTFYAVCGLDESAERVCVAQIWAVAILLSWTRTCIQQQVL